MQKISRNWAKKISHKKSGEKTMAKEPAKTDPILPKPSTRKVIIALMARWKKPTETENKTSPSGAD
jgi:hypothetical protein